MRVNFQNEFSCAKTDEDALLVAKRVEDTLSPEIIKAVDNT